MTWLMTFLMLSATHMFFSGGRRDSWSLVRRSSQPHIAEIGRRTTLCTANPRETMFLYQRIPVAIQRFSVPCQHVHSY